jgi:hypothetical protein
MFPIRGMVVKQDYRSLWCAYLKGETDDGREEYKLIGAFPPQPTPTGEAISNLFTS